MQAQARGSASGQRLQSCEDALDGSLQISWLVQDFQDLPVQVAIRFVPLAFGDIAGYADAGDGAPVVVAHRRNGQRDRELPSVLGPVPEFALPALGQGRRQDLFQHPRIAPARPQNADMLALQLALRVAIGAAKRLVHVEEAVLDVGDAHAIIDAAEGVRQQPGPLLVRRAGRSEPVPQIGQEPRDCLSCALHAQESHRQDLARQ